MDIVFAISIRLAQCSVSIVNEGYKFFPPYNDPQIATKMCLVPADGSCTYMYMYIHVAMIGMQCVCSLWTSAVLALGMSVQIFTHCLLSFV